MTLTALAALLLAAALFPKPVAAQVVVSETRVRGARTLSEEDVRSLAGLTTRTRVDTLRIADAAERVAAAYGTEGFLDARVTIGWGRPVGDSASVERAFTIDVDEGRAWKIDRIDHEGVLPAIAGEVPRVVGLESGDRYRARVLETAIADLLDLYDENGHPYARVRPGKLDFRDGTVRLTLHHEPGPPVFLEKIELVGARSIRTRTAEQVMGFETGQPYRQSRLEAGIERLRSSGLFTDVSDAELVPGTDPAASRLRLTVREASSGSLSGIVGYSGADKRFAGDLDFRLRNIAGSGRQLRAHWSSRQRASTLYAFTYREPYLLGSPVDLSFDLEHVLFDTLYTRTRTDAALEWRIGTRFSLLAGVGQDNAVITSVVRRSESSLRTRAGARYDGLNSRVAPTGGIFLAVEGERGKTLSGLYGDLAGGGLLDLASFDFRGEVYRRVTRSTVAALLVTARSLETDAYPIPQYELFPLGGATSLRGYREEQFYTPGFVLAQLEYRLGTGRFGTGAYLFLDAAAFSDADDRATLLFDGGETKVGYGAGIRVGSRIGRVGVDYGLASGEGPLDGRIHLRLEAEF